MNNMIELQNLNSRLLGLNPDNGGSVLSRQSTYQWPQWQNSYHCPSPHTNELDRSRDINLDCARRKNSSVVSQEDEYLNADSVYFSGFHSVVQGSVELQEAIPYSVQPSTYR